MTIGPEALGRFFDTYNMRLGKCLEPRMACQREPIRAHSIQNARVIDLIARNGHVIALQPSFSSAGPEVEFKSVGRNNASTFTGLCTEHDASLFAPLDTRELDVNDREQLFLLAYRSVTRELHAVMEGAARIQAAYSSRVERGVDSGNEMSPAGMVATQHLLNSFETYQYRAQHFDKGLLSLQYDAIDHDIVTLNNQNPVIAVSALFSLDELRNDDDDIVRVVLNVIPINKHRTLVIFSYTSADRPKAKALLDRVLSSEGAYQKYELSKLILSRIENFLISPSHFQSWGSAKASLIKEVYIRTALKQVEIREHPDLMLF